MMCWSATKVNFHRKIFIMNKREQNSASLAPFGWELGGLCAEVFLLAPSGIQSHGPVMKVSMNEETIWCQPSDMMTSAIHLA